VREKSFGAPDRKLRVLPLKLLEGRLVLSAQSSSAPAATKLYAPGALDKSRRS